jgi:acetyl esterase/lipase
MRARGKFIVGLVALLVLTTISRAAEPAGFHRQEDVIYGRKFGMALTMDVFQPVHTNGYGIIFAASGGWVSGKGAVGVVFYKAFLDRGYTVFAVMHGAQPKFQIPEIVQDMKRAVRYVRFNAAHFGIDPDHLGMSGLSSGGHLSLMIATQGGPGPDDAKDPVERASSTVQCVACFFPPTDFLNYGGPRTNVIGEGTLAQFKPAFGTVPSDPEARRKYGESISPIYSITTNLPPTLIIQGEADRLVPPQQAISFRDRATAMGDTVKIIFKPGQGHGWKNLPPDLEICADWFDHYLRGKNANEATK